MTDPVLRLLREVGSPCIRREDTIADQGIGQRLRRRVGGTERARVEAARSSSLIHAVQRQRVAAAAVDKYASLIVARTI